MEWISATAWSTRGRSEHLDKVCGHPDVEPLKSKLDSFLASKRRSVLLIARRFFDVGQRTLDGKEPHGSFRDQHLASRPALAGVTPGQLAYRPVLRFQICKVDFDHTALLSPRVPRSQSTFLRR